MPGERADSRWKGRGLLRSSWCGSRRVRQDSRRCGGLGFHRSGEGLRSCAQGVVQVQIDSGAPKAVRIQRHVELNEVVGLNDRPLVQVDQETGNFNGTQVGEVPFHEAAKDRLRNGFHVFILRSCVVVQIIKRLSRFRKSNFAV